MSAKKRIIYLDILRIAACYFVIVVHVSANRLSVLPRDSFDFQVSLFLNTLAITAPALFFMLSGAVFLNPASPELSIKKLWSKYILRMAVSYVFWSFLYTFITWCPYYTLSLETVKAYILEFFTGTPMYHMWFIPTIISIYMVLPFLRPAFADKQRCKYYLVLFAIIQFLIPTVLVLDFSHIYLLESIYSKIPYLLCVGYVGYFVLGHYLNTEDFNKNTRILIYVLGILSLVIETGINSYISLDANTTDYRMGSMFSICTLLFLSAVFVAFRYTSWKAERLIKIVSGLSKLTFGIYLIHPLFLNIFFNNCSFLFELPALIWIPVITTATFLCGAIVIWIISKIPVANKYLI